MEGTTKEDRACLDAIIAEVLNVESLLQFPEELDLGIDKEKEIKQIGKYE